MQPPAAPLAGSSLAPHSSATSAQNLFGLERAELESLCASLGEPRYRAAQLYGWLYARRARSLEAMTSLSRGLRASLAAHGTVRWPEVASRLVSTDGTLKFLLALEDGATVECVLIPEPRRRTICLSTQAGCPLKCAFCLTGLTGLRRNLTAGEILGQVAVVVDDSPPSEHPWNIVLMGMGEPLLNLEATLGALRVLMDEQGFAIPPRRVTLSTVGILPALERLAAEPVRPNLAISLHAANPALRRRLMPIETAYPLTRVLAAADRYRPPSGGRVTIEYVLLHGLNDSPEEARRLVRLIGDRRFKVNLIPLNPAPQIPFGAPTPEAIEAFVAVLSAAEVTVSVRRPRGQDVLAACGQLHVTRGQVTP
jgi:23S rRNA (adenine2503-C2)-methyltransferase